MLPGTCVPGTWYSIRAAFNFYDNGRFAGQVFGLGVQVTAFCGGGLARLDTRSDR